MGDNTVYFSKIRQNICRATIGKQETKNQVLTEALMATQKIVVINRHLATKYKMGSILVSKEILGASPYASNQVD